ncbi:hypothetical protein [Paenibacillus polymyxa]|uniref:Uncharacterized protein n=1 Tax=Paenibacillus polymyxa (strain SC2) TaxID=886882 RepID=E3EK83_PAEPS|nr:hypothetical protein [Paenibacillus polymyxa]ADO59411.1 hypothetical protein PPSC2_28005 [Paenibacillus polymyxa SC2]WPQ59749.1 hypothetical protein SKN87_26025 [Paenibacillus polymyxa]
MPLINELVLSGRRNHKVIFSRPYLNNEKELTFLYCSEFIKYPTLEFVLNEDKKAIEIRNLKGRKMLILLQDSNTTFLRQALKMKEEILSKLKKYTQDLKTGKEIIFIFETADSNYPYFFTSNTLLEAGQYSIKFEVGLNYFLNQHASKDLPDFMEVQRKFSKKFATVNKEPFLVRNKEEMYYKMTFAELCQICS